LPLGVFLVAFFGRSSLIKWLGKKRHLHSLTQSRILSWTEVLQEAAAYGSARLVVVTDFHLNASKRRVAEVLAGTGFRQRCATARLATTPPRQLLEAGGHIDWAFVRGQMQVDKARVHGSIKASDQCSISLSVSPYEDEV
jgi:hypothetical protein